MKRKVDRVWVLPGGMRLEPDKNFAIIEFYVDRQGNLLDTPKVVQQASDPALSESGLRALLLAAPLPPLPETYGENTLRVLYRFEPQGM